MALKRYPAGFGQQLMRLVTTAVALASVSLSCGPQTQQLTTQPPKEPRAVNQLVLANTAPISSCEPAACPAACDGGDINACTRAGDAVFAKTPEPAVALFKRACDGKDLQGCERLMELTGADPVVSDIYTSKACSLGSKLGCAMASELALLAFSAPRDGESRGGFLKLAEDSSRRACAFGHYGSCLNGIALLSRRDGDTKELERRGVELGKVACAQGDPTACDLVGQAAERAGDKATAGQHYLARCHLDRQLEPKRLDGSVQRFEDVPSCAKAGELLGSMDKVSSSVPSVEPSAERIVPHTSLLPLRTGGKTRVSPPPGEARAMRGTGRTFVALMKMCLTDRGRPAEIRFLRKSALSGWNRELFEAMRSWRYNPYIENGKPTAVCTVIQFLFVAH